eukprot:CAMPEP_0198521190 /NCGR_PEP_ID=MMETSP1462-20131121/20779_1 /TAXON_ID=1333877 /ORGANISM="Brandtodinium nutriculum, Strain RCC3387" /LENGTH=77 /DNA_ID=CAMNT_0044250829 /DNA_START=78 /DNA_END=308 /DNA_ORIENTATION=-
MQESAIWQLFSRCSRDSKGRVLKRRLLGELCEGDGQASVTATFPQLPLQRVLQDLSDTTDDMIDFDEFRCHFNQDII